MNEENFASYVPGTFTIKADKIHFDYEAPDGRKDLIRPSDLPAFIHEWTHYIQEVGTISAQIGFYMWMRDVAIVSKQTCAAVGAVVSVPLNDGDYNVHYWENEKIYEEYTSVLKSYSLTALDIDGDGEIQPFRYKERTFSNWVLKVDKQEVEINIVAIQEMNAFYAQRIKEASLPNVEFVANTASLPLFPYQLGDALFRAFEIECDDRCKFLITFGCLDTLQPAATLRETLKMLRGKSLVYGTDNDLIDRTICDAEKTHCHSKLEACTEFLKDYSNWIADSGRKEFVKAIKWYLLKCYASVMCISKIGIGGIGRMLIDGSESENLLLRCFPPPIISVDDMLYGTKSMFSATEGEDYDDDHFNALVIWSLKKLMKILTCEERSKINELACCPLYKHCIYKEKVGKEIDCKYAPWEVLQGEKICKCPFGIALSSMGLWQNRLEIDASKLR